MSEANWGMDEINKEQLFEEFANSIEKFYKSGMPYEQWRESVRMLYVAYCSAVGKQVNYDLQIFKTK